MIQKPEVLLLDEPTNNLDVDGIANLIKFLKEYKKTVIVISHDADFFEFLYRRCFIFKFLKTHKVEKFDGNYNNVVEHITSQIKKEERKNAQAEKEIQLNKDKANFFANKGGRLRAVAKKNERKSSRF